MEIGSVIFFSLGKFSVCHFDLVPYSDFSISFPFGFNGHLQATYHIGYAFNDQRRIPFKGLPRRL